MKSRGRRRDVRSDLGWVSVVQVMEVGGGGFHALEPRGVVWSSGRDHESRLSLDLSVASIPSPDLIEDIRELPAWETSSRWSGLKLVRR